MNESTATLSASPRDGLTVVIEGGDRWRVPPREGERAKMAAYINRIGDVSARCHDCAFRQGSEASNSRLVVHLIEMCLGDENNNFCCHHGEADRPCAGFVALRDSFSAGKGDV